jgi:O-succinylhomoserine sulfhydrylase
MAEEARLEVGITEDMLRLNVGLEDADDVIEDLDRALKSIGR